MSEVKDNANKEENKEQEINKSKEKPVLKISTKKGSKPKETPKEDTKFESTDKISPQYVKGLEETVSKLRIHLLLQQIKYGHITTWIEGIRKFMMDEGLAIQVKSKENESLLNITDKLYDINFMKEQIQLGANDYNEINGLNKKGK